MGRRTIFALALGVAAAGAAMAQGWWDALATWDNPDEQSLVATASFADSDEDAVYALQRAWRKQLEDSQWLLGWELGVGAADSGKYDRTGGLATADLVFKRLLWERGRLDLGFNGVAGGQLQTIRFPGESYHNGRLGVFFDVSWEINDGSAVELRFGYLHISNANLSGGNEGHDAYWAGAGWRW